MALPSFHGVQPYETNRGGPSTVEWANVYWANRLAAGLGKKCLAISISGEGTKKTSVPTLYKGMQLKTLQEVKKLLASKGEDALKPKDFDVSQVFVATM